ncbi:MAG: hypothetical protein OH335_04380 [Candidatus Parvarchaeota archaeon]|nr:hypothetical protein [Candidatus Jingweiarchaeum tengchongense]
MVDEKKSISNIGNPTTTSGIRTLEEERLSSLVVLPDPYLDVDDPDVDPVKIFESV